MKILNQTETGKVGRVLLEEKWLTPNELDTLDEIRKSGCEIKE